jgi:hypothetical protein
LGGGDDFGITLAIPYSKMKSEVGEVKWVASKWLWQRLFTANNRSGMK